VNGPTRRDGIAELAASETWYGPNVAVDDTVWLRSVVVEGQLVHGSRVNRLGLVPSGNQTASRGGYKRRSGSGVGVERVFTD